jgi:hypothetical protein
MRVALRGDREVVGLTLPDALRAARILAEVLHLAQRELDNRLMLMILKVRTRSLAIVRHHEPLTSATQVLTSISCFTPGGWAVFDLDHNHELH